MTGFLILLISTLISSFIGSVFGFYYAQHKSIQDQEYWELRHKQYLEEDAYENHKLLYLDQRYKF